MEALARHRALVEGAAFFSTLRQLDAAVHVQDGVAARHDAMRVARPMLGAAATLGSFLYFLGNIDSLADEKSPVWLAP